MNNDKIQSFIVLRAFAFLGIFLLHAGCPVNWSNFGVSIFFVLSGFLLAYRHLNYEACGGYRDSIRFAITHIKRIYPLHIITMCIAIVLNLWVITADEHEYIVALYESRLKIILNLILLQSWYPSVRINVSLNGVAWFLSSIFFCYFIFLPVNKRISKISKGFKILMAGMIFTVQLIITAILLGFDLEEDVFRWATYDAPFFRAGDFIVGMIAGNVCINNAKEPKVISFDNLRKLLLAITILFGIAINLWDNMGNHFSFISRVLTNWTTLYIPFSLCVIVLLYYEKSFLSNNCIINYIGNNSNYFFLIHYVVIMIIKLFLRNRGLEPKEYWLYVVILGGGISVVTTELYKLAEFYIRKISLNDGKQ